MYESTFNWIWFFPTMWNTYITKVKPNNKAFTCCDGHSGSANLPHLKRNIIDLQTVILFLVNNYEQFGVCSISYHLLRYVLKKYLKFSYSPVCSCDIFLLNPISILTTVNGTISYKGKKVVNWHVAIYTHWFFEKRTRVISKHMRSRFIFGLHILYLQIY